MTQNSHIDSSPSLIQLLLTEVSTTSRGMAAGTIEACCCPDDALSYWGQIIGDGGNFVTRP